MGWPGAHSPAHIEHLYDARTCTPVVARGPEVVWYGLMPSHARLGALPLSILLCTDFCSTWSKAAEVYDHANFLSPTGPELTTELPR